MLRALAPLVVLALLAAGGPATPVAADAPLLGGDLTLLLWGHGLVALVDERGTPVFTWIVPRSEAVFDLELLPNGHLLVTLGGVGGLLSEAVGLHLDTDGVVGGAVVELDATSRVVWSLSTVAGQTLSWTHDVDYLEETDSFLIADTTFLGSAPDRVIEVDRAGNLLWAYYPPDASYPNDADRLPNGNTLVSLRDLHEVLEVDPAGNVVWRFGGADGTLRGQHNPDRLPNGNTLIADSMNERVIEVTPSGEIAWEYGGRDVLRWPRDADRLPNGNTLITDTHNARIVEVTPAGEVVWEVHPPGPELNYDADRVNAPPVVEVRAPRGGGAPVRNPVRFDVTVSDASLVGATYRLFDVTVGAWTDDAPLPLPGGTWTRALASGHDYRLDVVAWDAGGEGGGWPQDDSVRERTTREVAFRVA